MDKKGIAIGQSYLDVAGDDYGLARINGIVSGRIEVNRAIAKMSIFGNLRVFAS
jgi:hypothetical protein